jgi:hypothetical protein
MARRPQTFAKRARELELKERRERKRAKKAEAAAQRGEPADEEAVPDGGEIEAPTDEDASAPPS